MIMNEFEHVEKRIAALTPHQLPVFPVESDQLKEDLAWFSQECSRIKRDLQTRYHDYKSKHREEYIRLNQRDLLRILDQIEDCLQSPEISATPYLIGFYEDIYRHLEKILVHLTKYFSEAMDPDLPMPPRFATHEKAKFLPGFEQLLQLYYQPELQKPLLNVAFQPLKEFFYREAITFTFRQMHYFKVLIAELLPLVDIPVPLHEFQTFIGDQEMVQEISSNDTSPGNQAEHDLNWQIHYKLHYLNFNNIEYRNFCTHMLHTKLEKLPSLREQVESVRWYISTENRQHQKPGMALEPGLPPITKQILKIIEEEYKYLLENENLSASQGTTDKGNGINKLKMKLTSLELAQLAAIFEQAGIMEGRAIDIISYLARNFVTEAGEDLQESSLRTQFYSRGNHAVYARLLTWLQRIQKLLNDKIQHMALTILWVITGNFLSR